MADIVHILPHFSTLPFAHLLPSLDKAAVTTAELLSSQPIDIARRAQVPPSEVSKLTNALIEALHHELVPNKQPPWKCISILDDDLDAALGGGFPAGNLTEVTGESGAGKTQVLLSLLLSVQLAEPCGFGKSALYISTEAPLSTSRLAQLLETHPRLASLEDDQKPSLSRVHAIQTLDLEAQEQIIRYQVPVAIQRLNIGLIVIDSIASNYRAEFDELPGTNTPRNGRLSSGRAMGERMRLLTQLGSFLRDLAREENIAIVVSNQVSDRFDLVTPHTSQTGGPDPLSLDHQQRWFTGWGDLQYESIYSAPKTPALGLVWANQIAARIALIKEGIIEERRSRRWLRLVFSSWSPQTNGPGIEYEITTQGVAAIRREEVGTEQS